jgi:cell wall-associated NlpC family hydrolase
MNNAERNKFNDFLAAGIEKGLNTQTASADKIIETAEKYLGVPHCMGGTTMKCMDCSGLLLTVFARLGINLPHNSEEQARYGKIISRTDELRKGDLVFFIRTYETHHFITHSGIYAGNYKFIHASAKNGVIITSINDPWWNQKFIFGTRVLK